MVTRLAPPEPGAVGLDEAGRGCLAGPVVAAAVVLPPRVRLPGLDDSKKLKPHQRDELAGLLYARATAWGVGFAWQREIERINIAQASLLAMGRALAALARQPGLDLLELRIDGKFPMPAHLAMGLPQVPVIDGDAKERVIAAASILAKTRRDGLMAKLDDRYPGYGLAKHKGYGTAEHVQALAELGPCRLHRRTFKGVRPEPKQEMDLCLPGI